MQSTSTQDQYGSLAQQQQQQQQQASAAPQRPAFTQGASNATVGDSPQTETINRYSKKNVNAQAGKFVINFPVSYKGILKDAIYQDGEEFTHATYTAVTCDPDDFHESYDLRQRRYNRITKIALVCTMYNEDETLFIKSLHAVQKNIAFLCSDQCPFSWGQDGWKNFVVCIVSDGRAKINARVKTVLSVLGIFSEGLLRTTVNGLDVQGHIFEYTTQIDVDRDLKIRTRKEGIFPMQVCFILKEKNAKKINSHKWFFNAVCEVLQPEVTMLLDVGTKPTAQSFYHLYRAFERNKMVGGACGEIKAELGQNGQNLLNPLVASQNFEYKMSNILDKPLESVCGYISVLPGAFSAYRYKALLGEPLHKYFLGEKPGADIFTSNLYLAEDRILCFELVAKKTEAWRLKYVKSASAETDVPDKLPELISQRRRWLNGSFFAALYALTHFPQIFRSPHSAFQKFIFTLEFIYMAVGLFFSWFSLANFYLSFFFLFNVAQNVNSETSPFGKYTYLTSQFVQNLYVFSIICIFISSLSNRPQGSKWLYYVLSILFGIIMCVMLFLGGWSIYQAIKNFENRPNKGSETLWQYFRATTIFRDLVISILSTYGLYLVSSLMHLDPWHCVTSMFQYLIMLPTYNNIFMIYSFCNLHDVSWGTKGDNTEKKDDKPAVAKTNIITGQQSFEVEVPMDEDDVDAAWVQNQKTMSAYKDNPVEENNTVDKETADKDKKQEFRTKVVLSWVGCNTLLIALMTNTVFVNDAFHPSADNAVNPYLTFLFWSVACLAAIRFVGCTIFMINWWGERTADSIQSGKRR